MGEITLNELEEADNLGTQARYNEKVIVCLKEKVGITGQATCTLQRGLLIGGAGR